MSNLPDDVTLDLDSVEKPAEDVIPDFKVNVGGRTVVFTNPDEIDWQDLLYIEQPTQFLSHCVSAEDAEYLRSQKIPGWKFGRMIEAFQKHFKIEEKVREGQRQLAAQQRGGF